MTAIVIRPHAGVPRDAGHAGHSLITTRCHFTPLVHFRPPSRVFHSGERGAVAALGREAVSYRTRPGDRDDAAGRQPPGWYPDPRSYLDPAGQEVLRWWDGARWGQETHPLLGWGQEPPVTYPRQPYGQQAVPPSGSQSWLRRHKVLAVLGGILGLWVLAGIATAALSGGGHPAAPAATQLATTKATARPKVSHAPKARTRSAQDACEARPLASGDIYVRMITPGEAPIAQELGGEWGWDYTTDKCLTSVQFIIATAPQTSGNCTQVGYVADNPGYDPNATPAAPLAELAAESGPAC